MLCHCQPIPNLKGLKLANPLTSGEKFNITLLIGADYYWQVVEDQIVRRQGPIAMKSKLGYLLSGPLTLSTKQSENHAASVLHISTQSVQQSNLFWNMESTATSPASVDSDKAFMTEYQSTCISRQVDGSYMAQFPWKPNHPPLSTNRTLCEKRTRALARRLAMSPDLLNAYSTILNDQERWGS